MSLEESNDKEVFKSLSEADRLTSTFREFEQEYNTLQREFEFKKFFNLAVRVAIDKFKRVPTKDLPPQEIILIKHGCPPISIYLSVARNGIPPSAVAGCLIQKANPDAYILVGGCWATKPMTDEEQEEYRKTHVYGEIVELPPDKRREMLSIVGKTKDGRQKLEKIFEIKREVHCDETSKVLDIVDLGNNFESYHPTLP